MSQRIRICMFTYNFLPEYSGAALQCYHLLQSLKRTGVETFIITLSCDRKLKKYEMMDGIYIERIFLNKNNYFTGKTGNPFKIFFTIYKNRNKFDILHSHGFNLWVILTANLLKKKLIVKQTQIGVDDADSLKKQKLGSIKTFVLPKANFIICISNLFVDIMNKNNKHNEFNFCLIPNGVNTHRFCPPKDKEEKKIIRKRLNLPNNFKIIVFTGSIIYRKGIDILIESWELICKKSCKKNMLLLLIGPKGDNDLFNNKIDELIKKYDLSKTINLTGQVDNVEDYLKASDIFVLPTRAEGMANALLEAMACGLPCVASKLEGVTDSVINDGVDGLLTRVEDIEALSEALSKLLTDKQLRKTIGINARKEITKNYQIQEIALKYIELYKELLACKGVVHQI